MWSGEGMQAEKEKWSMATGVCGMFYVVNRLKFDCDSCITLNFQETLDFKLHSCEKHELCLNKTLPKTK